ncbi:MAG: redox-sensing transcriptional repressor Rex [Erysipelotrichaceae bacterium]|nr:redox-sensing transcriptional repressor Rex [Erysipelotrichaceae bacterium]
MDEKVKKIPKSSRKRFPLYLRVLQQYKQKGYQRVMSYQIGSQCNVAADTVRRDLMYVKHQGKSASGYDVDSLIESFNEELGTTQNETKIVLIGVGNIGQGLLKYNYIPSHVGHIECAYDIDPNKIGSCINGVKVYDLSMLKQTFPSNCSIAILAIPKDNIDEIVSRLVNLKVKAIINFSDGVPRKRNNLVIHQIDLTKIISEVIYDLKINEEDKNL